MLRRIKESGDVYVHIVSRGVANKIKQNLAATHPEILELVDGIQGANSDEDVYKGTTEMWANKKLRILKTIKSLYLINANKVIVNFFDDTVENVQAVINGDDKDIHAFRILPGYSFEENLKRVWKIVRS